MEVPGFYAEEAGTVRQEIEDCFPLAMKVQEDLESTFFSASSVYAQIFPSNMLGS